MDELKQLTDLLQKKGDLLYLLNRHSQDKERIWGNDEAGYKDFVDAILDEIIDTDKQIHELSQDDF